MLNKMLLYAYTIRYLKPRQIWYRFYYSLINVFIGSFRTNKLEHLPHKKMGKVLILKSPITTNTSYKNVNSFNFLNTPHSFVQKIDWNYSSMGKLWTYNLNYFDFLHQAHLSTEEGIKLMMDFGNQYETIVDGLEPYPTSLRVMNWVKFLSLRKIENLEIDKIIYSDLSRLQCNIEYHLLGNHLLENGFALLFGAYHFQDIKLLDKSKGILIPELEEQILDDGAHFELSPMYHQIILTRVLDAINLISNNESLDFEGLNFALEKKAKQMLGWLNKITFSNGDVPHVNDSTWDIAPSTASIAQYAQSHSIDPIDVKLSACGYRKYSESNYELIIDVGKIGPEYIPGHAHSDTLNFVLYHQGKPIIVDTGITTYEKNGIRQLERSTASHNTVMIDNMEQSQIWGGFRVAKRAKCKIIEESRTTLRASHNGYRKAGIIHNRSFDLFEDKIIIEDNLTKKTNGRAFLHFHPDIAITLHDNYINGIFGEIKIEGAEKIKNDKYLYSMGFHRTKEATVVIIQFRQNLKTTFLPL